MCWRYRWLRKNMSLLRHGAVEPIEELTPVGGQAVTLVVDDFKDNRARGTVVGSSGASGAIRRGRDIEHQIAIDHGALRFQPLVKPGWGRQGIAYGPFRREDGLVLAVSITNGHNTSQSSPIPEHIIKRLYRWLVGPEIDPWPGRLVALVRGPRRKGILRRFWWWVRSWNRTNGQTKIDENLAVGWFTSEAPTDPLVNGCGFVIHAAEGENGELWARVGKHCLSAFRRLKNLRTYYVVVLREQGAIYYAAAGQEAHGLAGLPMMRPIAVDPFNRDERLFVGIHQSALGQIGFRVDTRVHGVHIGRMPEFARSGTAHAADSLGEHGVPAGMAEVGGAWRILRGRRHDSATDDTDTLAVLDPSRPSGLVHMLVDTGDVTGACGVAWRIRDRDNFWLLKISADDIALVRREQGAEVVVAKDTRPSLQPGSTHSIQILDWDDEVSCHLDGRRLFAASLTHEMLEDATAVGVWTSGDGEMRMRRFEAHPREVPFPSTVRFKAPWKRFGERVSFADHFTGPPGEMEGRAPSKGRGSWEKTLGAGIVDVDGQGQARVRATSSRPNRGRTFYSLPWSKPGFADLEVSITPPGDCRGQDHRSRGGVLFWQDTDNYLCVTTWLDDVHQGASISVFIKRFGFEELYDAIWTNVADKVVWGKRFVLRTAFDGNCFNIFVDGEPIMQRSLTDVYPDDPPLRIARVGLAVNWEWGNDTGSTFETFTARY
jgi:hypothetical protein